MILIIIACISLIGILMPTSTITQQGPATTPVSTKTHNEPKIAHVYVRGNVNVPTQAILIRLPLRVGDTLSPIRLRAAIFNLYQLGYFITINIYSKPAENDTVDVYVVVKEKPLKKDVLFEGNNNLNEKEIEKKVDFSKIPAFNEDDLKYFALMLQKLYATKNFHAVTITPELIHQDNAATAVFKIDEGKQAVVKRIFVRGNNQITTKKIKNTIITKEDWILGFYDHAGSYLPDAIGYDRYLIESLYKNNGFLEAKVIDVVVDKDPETQCINLTYDIFEGPLYIIKEVHVQGTDYLSQEELLERIPVKIGQLYSEERIQKSIELLRILWGEYGFIFANIEPSVQVDEVNHTVSVTLYNELGNKTYLNQLHIIGNRKTRDRVIRRNIFLEEGDLITSKGMDESKNSVELLGYFDKRDGVNWKINRLSDMLADLELHLNEAKTGNFYIQASWGGDPDDPSAPGSANNNFIWNRLKATAGWNDTNFLGRGYRIALTAELSFNEQNVAGSIANPYLFDRPLLGELSGYFKNIKYEDIFNIQEPVKEQRGGFLAGLGFYLPWGRAVQATSSFGFEHLHFDPQPRASIILTETLREQYQFLLNQRFQNGMFFVLNQTLFQDLRNHPVFPTNGYQWNVIAKVGLPINSNAICNRCCDNKYGFFKAEADASWYTPLIGETDLVLCVHGHGGFIEAFPDSVIPYRELFHIGGPATVRGYIFGEIGPTFLRTSAGGTKTVYTNIELIFPIMADFSILGHVFYDGGAGWDTPNAAQIRDGLAHNNFDYRHAIGVGLRIYQPFPVQIDYGIKLNRRPGEKQAELMLAMNHYY